MQPFKKKCGLWAIVVNAGQSNFTVMACGAGCCRVYISSRTGLQGGRRDGTGAARDPLRIRTFDAHPSAPLDSIAQLENLKKLHEYKQRATSQIEVE